MSFQVAQQEFPLALTRDVGDVPLCVINLHAEWSFSKLCTYGVQQFANRFTHLHEVQSYISDYYILIFFTFLLQFSIFTPPFENLMMCTSL